MADFLASYLMIDRTGCALAVGIIVVVFAGANHAWRLVRPSRKTSDG